MLKALGKKYSKPDFLRLNNSKIAWRLVQSSKVKITKELIAQTNFKVLNWIRIKEGDVSNKL